jgi:hypothetical protein
MDIYTTMETSHSIMHQEDIDSEYDYLDYSPDTNKSSSSEKKPYYYPSNVPDQFIKNAVTGVKYPWRVGSFDSSRLFKVVDTIGKYDSNGYKIKPNSKNYPNPSPNHCYYDSPQQYMVHRKMIVQPELIERWKLKQESFKDMDN